MAHPLEEVMRDPRPFVLIGDSSQDRFPATSYHAYTRIGRPFYCLDLGGMTESRGPTTGGKVYPKVADLPADRSDLAIIWVKPRSAARAVDVAHEAGCKRVWFSFETGHRDAVARARELGMEVVEIGRCPVYYSGPKNAMCAAHMLWVKASGTYGLPPQTDPDSKHRELW
jgi:hypothetical protein